MIGEPRLDDRAEQAYVALRAQVTMQNFGSVIDRSYPEVFGWLAARGIEPAGPPLIRYLVIDMAATLEVDIGVPVASRVEGDGRVVSDVLPAGRYAVLLNTGPYSDLILANAALLEWGAAQGLIWDQWSTPQGDAFGSRVESYITDPRAEPDQSTWQTEVMIRLRPD
jgi:effector-binding domain-containing protein